MVTRTSTASASADELPMQPQPSRPAKDSCTQFCLPQNRSGPTALKQETTTQVDRHASAQMGGVRYEDEQCDADGAVALDYTRYVKEAARIAEEAKLAKRKDLKEQQKRKEEEAGRAGRSLSAKDKERERSRRESAVTRKRTEVYIAELERHATKVPALEQRIALLEDQLRRLLREQRAGVSVKEEEEQGVMMSPNSTGTTRKVTSAMRELGL
eukprot:GFKZ01015564.1.p1 GENE.GFKZ01015564.1~~GFKZ01015564.1.p1  ORF type:complete len:229 (+),score=53.18 GFKZ01015564.1:51-689(+)